MSGITEQEIAGISESARKSAIKAFGANGDPEILSNSARSYLVGKTLYANAAPGEVQATNQQVKDRKEKIITDITDTLESYKRTGQGMLLGDRVKGNPPQGASIQDVVDQYIERLIKEDAQTEKERKDPKNIEVGNQFLTKAVNQASVNTNRGIGNQMRVEVAQKVSLLERAQAEKDIAAAVEAVRQEEQVNAAQTQAAAVEAARQAALAQAEVARGGLERAGEKADELLSKTGQAVGGPLSRREAFLALAAAGAGGFALSQTGCPKPTVSNVATTPLPAPKPKLPEGFIIIKKLSGGNPPVEENAVLASESKVEKNALLFVGKNTNQINADQGVFNDNGITEIHITNPREHPSEITIDTPKYVCADAVAKGTAPVKMEKDRTKVDLCLHPSVLANYTLFANSIPNGLGEHSKDVVLSFIPKREVDAEAMKPFKIVIKGHGIDKGGVHKGGIFDQSGVDRIKIIDNTGQNLGELNLVNLPTADVFTGALNALQLEVGKSNYDPEPLKIGNPIMLERFANKRRLDLSQSHGQGGTLMLPVRSGGVGGRG